MGKSTIDSVRDMIWPCTKLIQIAHFPYKVCGNRAALNTLIILYKYTYIYAWYTLFSGTPMAVHWFIAFSYLLIHNKTTIFTTTYHLLIRLVGESIWINLDHPKIEPRLIITIKPRWIIIPFVDINHQYIIVRVYVKNTTSYHIYILLPYHHTFLKQYHHDFPITHRIHVCYIW